MALLTRAPAALHFMLIETKQDSMMQISDKLIFFLNTNNIQNASSEAKMRVEMNPLNQTAS